MPELPEVEAITGVVRNHATGNTLTSIEMVRWNGKYFSSPRGPLISGGWDVEGVYRVGKRVYLKVGKKPGFPKSQEFYIVVHNAMSGFFDWEHEPWSFDYVEGKRNSSEGDVRVRFHFKDGKVLRFHDTRLFGSMKIESSADQDGPELMELPNMMPGLKVISFHEFRMGLRHRTKPIKDVLMDQSFLAGIGNIYASESCHLAGVDPVWPACAVPDPFVPLLFESLKLCVQLQNPQVTYGWLNVYRRSHCGSCGHPVHRELLNKRSTFSCERCQWEP